MNRSAILGIALALVGCDDGPDEWTCTLEVEGVSLCADLDRNGDKTCKSDLNGTAAVVEQEPGGPYVYCEDLGFEVQCSGDVVEFYPYYAKTEADCATADGT